MLHVVTWKDANLLLFINEFSEEFVKCHITSLMNLYSEYNQQILHQAS